MPVVVVLPRRRRLPLGAGIIPPSSAPFLPLFSLSPRHLRPTGPSAPIIGFIPIRLFRCTTITPAAATTDLFLPSRPTATATATSRRPGLCCRCRGCPSSNVPPSARRGSKSCSPVSAAGVEVDPPPTPIPTFWSLELRNFPSLSFCQNPPPPAPPPSARRESKSCSPVSAAGVEVARPTCFHHIERAVR